MTRPRSSPYSSDRRCVHVGNRVAFFRCSGGDWSLASKLQCDSTLAVLDLIILHERLRPTSSSSSSSPSSSAICFFTLDLKYLGTTTTCRRENILLLPSHCCFAVFCSQSVLCSATPRTKNSQPASAYLRGTRLELETTRGLANGRDKIETTAHPFTSQG